MGATSWSGSGSEGYTTSSGGGLSPWIGWGISTLLLFFLNRKSDNGSSTSSQQPSKFTEDNVNCIGQPVPVVLGRCVVKNPLISYYGDFNSEPYTEEYGMHSEFDAASVLWPFLLAIIAALLMPSTHKVEVVTSSGAGTGYALDVQNGTKFELLTMAVLNLLIALLLNLFNDHAGRTTIQKGFLYYLGWQHIICWTGRNIGIKKLWMNVYDSKIETSTEQGVWDNNGHIAWEKDNINGITAYIDDKDMFGGYDEGGGFTGQVRFYFGNRQQPKDPWMIKSMNVSTIPDELKGLTPQYPMYLTCVVSNSAKNGGAYIGKQATIPEMWFEVVNYPARIGKYWITILLEKFITKLGEEFTKINNFISAQDPSVQSYMDEKMSDLQVSYDNYIDKANEFLIIPSWDEYISEVNDWASNVVYSVGDIVMYDSSRFACIVSHTSSDSFLDDIDNWNKLEQATYVGWQENTNYVCGNVVLHIGQVYTCKKDHTSPYSFSDKNWILYERDFPPQSLLDDLYNKAVAAYDYYPPTNRENFGMVLSTLESMCQYGVWHLGRLDDDLNPSEAIYEILTNTYWGCGYLESKIDVNSLVDLGVVCEQEKLGVSCLINRTAQSNDYITKILNHVNGVKYDDPKTGKLTFKLIRNDYDVNNIKKFDVSNTESCEFSRLDWSETTSAVEVSFTDASNKYDTGQFTFTDISNRLITGFYTSKSVDGDYFTTTANAKWLAQMNQLANGYPLSAINLVTNRYAYDVTIGDPIKVSWEPYGLKQVVYRVTDIDYANLTDGKISITGIEDVFGFDKLDFDTPESPQWTDPEEQPTNIGRYIYEEEPYEISRSLNTYIYAYAAQPNGHDVYWDVWRQVHGNYMKTSQSMAWSTVGRLTYGYLKGFDVDAEGFEFSILGNNGEDLIEQKIEKIINYPTTYTSTSGLNLLFIDNEYMSYETIEKLPNGHYRVKGVIRGIFDTLPEQHTAESIIFFVENRQNIAGTGNAVAMENDSPVTEKLELRTETRTLSQPFDLSLVEEYTTSRRSERLSVMANLQYGVDIGEDTIYQYDYTTSTIFSGDLLFKFIGRNKFNNYGIISQVDRDTDVKVAESTYNVIKTSSSGIDGEFRTLATYTEIIDDIEVRKNVEEDSLTWSSFCELMGDKIKYQNTVTIEVMTYDSMKELYSYSSYMKTIDWRTPRFVGVVADQAEAQTLADSYVLSTSSTIVVSATTVSPQIALLYTECPILIEGIQVTGTSSVNDILCQDGNIYRLSNMAYRIIGKDEDNNAILYPFTINPYYIFRTDFTQLVDNYSEYWQYNGTNWQKYMMV